MVRGLKFRAASIGPAIRPRPFARRRRGVSLAPAQSRVGEAPGFPFDLAHFLARYDRLAASMAKPFEQNRAIDHFWQGEFFPGGFLRVRRAREMSEKFLLPEMIARSILPAGRSIALFCSKGFVI